MSGNTWVCADLRAWFEYDSSGNLRWKQNPTKRIKIGDLAGNVREDGYTEVGFKGGRYLLHRLIYEWHTQKPCPPLIDHLDRDHTNNRIENLRPASKSLNAHNSTFVCGAVPIRGVSFDKRRNKFVAYLKTNGKRKFLGYFKTKETAGEAYSNAKLSTIGGSQT